MAASLGGLTTNNITSSSPANHRHHYSFLLLSCHSNLLASPSFHSPLAATTPPSSNAPTTNHASASNQIPYHTPSNQLITPITSYYHTTPSTILFTSPTNNTHTLVNCLDSSSNTMLASPYLGSSIEPSIQARVSEALLEVPVRCLPQAPSSQR